MAQSIEFDVGVEPPNKVNNLLDGILQLIVDNVLVIA